MIYDAETKFVVDRQSFGYNIAGSEEGFWTVDADAAVQAGLQVKNTYELETPVFRISEFQNQQILASLNSTHCWLQIAKPT